MTDIIFERIKLVENFIAPICIDWVYEGKYISNGKMYFGGCFLEAEENELETDNSNIYDMVQELLILFEKR